MRPKDLTDMYGNPELYPNEAVFQWKNVPGATTYRVQWGAPDAETGTVPEDAWIDVWSGAQMPGHVETPKTPLLFRIRAETGTPEDDPTFQKVLKMFEHGTQESKYLSYIYTMQEIDKETLAFVVAHSVDWDQNRYIDPYERGLPIGLRYTAVARKNWTGE